MVAQADSALVVFAIIKQHSWRFYVYINEGSSSF